MANQGSARGIVLCLKAKHYEMICICFYFPTESLIIICTYSTYDMSFVFGQTLSCPPGPRFFDRSCPRRSRHVNYACNVSRRTSCRKLLESVDNLICSIIWGHFFRHDANKVFKGDLPLFVESISATILFISSFVASIPSSSIGSALFQVNRPSSILPPSQRISSFIH